MSDMTRGPILRGIVGFAVPATIANLLQQSYLFVDSLVVGRYLGDVGLAAVGAAGPMLSLVSAVFTGVATGFAIRFANMRGSGRRDGVAPAVVGLAGAAVVWAAVSTVLIIALAAPMLALTGITGPTAAASVDLQVVLAPGHFLFFGLGAVCSFLRGHGNARAPMALMVTCSLINMVLVWLFVGPLAMGIRGAGAAGLVANGVALAIGLGYTARAYPMRLRPVPWRRVRVALAEAMSLGTPVMVQFLLIGLGMTVLLWIIAPLGVVVLAAVTIVMRLEVFTTMIFSDLSGALTMFVAQNLGKGRVERVRRALRSTLGLAACLTVVVSVALVLGDTAIAALFKPTEQTRHLVEHYILLTYPFFGLYTLMVVAHGAMNGCGRTTMPLICTVVSFGLVRLPLSYLLRVPWGIDGVIWMIDFGWFVGFVYTAVVTYRHRFTPAAGPPAAPVELGEQARVAVG